MARLPAILLLGSAALVACGDDGGGGGAVDATVNDGGIDAPGGDAADDASSDAGSDPNAYEFESRFVPGESSVAYSGQLLRQVLIVHLTSYVSGLTGRLDDDRYNPTDGQVVADLVGNFYQFNASTSADVPLPITTTPPATQATYGQLGGSANLKDKVAGNDDATDWRDWDGDGVMAGQPSGPPTAPAFRGWSEGGAAADTPDELVLYWMGLLDDLAVARANDQVARAPRGDGTLADIGEVYVTSKGQDLKQLLQKFLLVSIAFSQATDDYLDHRDAGKGLNSSNAQEAGKPYSTLEHAWDEGFGYFGASRGYLSFSDDEVASATPYKDLDGDGRIDLVREYNFGFSTNAAKRDLGSTAPMTDFSRRIFEAFLAGRRIIAAAGDTLTSAELEALKAQRDVIVENWERVIAATVIHYLNQVLAHMDRFGDNATYRFLDHAKHWSEMKGFALGFQFNPASPLMDANGAEFAQLHAYLRDAPVLADATASEVAAYRADLQAARALLKTAYGFSDMNVESW